MAKKKQDKSFKIRKTLANLQIQTWVGRAPDASHYLGYIEFNGKEIHVERKLTFDESVDLNNRERLIYGEIRIKRIPGETSNEFLSKEEVIRRARKIFHRKLKQQGAVALVIGDRVVIGAKPIICVHWSSHNHIMKKANKIYKEVEALYDVDETEDDIDYKAIDELEDKWWKIIEELSK